VNDELHGAAQTTKHWPVAVEEAASSFIFIGPAERNIEERQLNLLAKQIDN
jgi:hypothetical protein